MNIYKTVMMIFAISLSVSTAGVAQELSGPVDVAVATPESISKPAPGPDDVQEIAVRQLAEALRKQLAKPNDELARTARKIARPLIASFRHDLDIARVDQRRLRLENIHISIIQMADEADEDRRQMNKEMHQKLADIKGQYSGEDDARHCDAAQLRVVKAFVPVLTQLKNRADALRIKADETSNQLVALRSDTLERESDRWLAEKAPVESPAAKKPIPRLKWLAKTEKSTPAEGDISTPQESVTLQAALAAIAELDNRK